MCSFTWILNRYTLLIFPIFNRQLNIFIYLRLSRFQTFNPMYRTNSNNSYTINSGIHPHYNTNTPCFLAWPLRLASYLHAKRWRRQEVESAECLSVYQSSSVHSWKESLSRVKVLRACCSLQLSADCQCAATSPYPQQFK